MSEVTLKCELEVVVTDEAIDDIMCGALEGGINYWCDRVRVDGDYLGEYASEQISRGGRLMLYDCEDDEVYMLDKEKFLKGLEMYIKDPMTEDILDIHNGVVNVEPCYADADVCDTIIQYALFGEIVFG